MSLWESGCSSPDAVKKRILDIEDITCDTHRFSTARHYKLPLSPVRDFKLSSLETPVITQGLACGHCSLL